MIWRRTISTESAPYCAPYADWVSDDGVWLCAEGMDEAERKLGRPIALLMIDKGRHLMIGCFATLKEAKQAAEEF